MRRREFIAGLGAAAWPIVVRAQQPAQMRRIGALLNLSPDDPESLSRVTAFAQGLQQLGWSDGRNVRIDFRWSAGDVERARQYAKELLELRPTVIVASGDGAAIAAHQVIRTEPIIFANVGDPIATGLVESLARPGGNATGFMNFEYGLSAKWLQFLRQIAPQVQRVAVLRDPTMLGNSGQVGAIQAMAPTLGVELTQIDNREVEGIERGIANFARQPNGGLIMTAGPQGAVLREAIITIAARNRLPAVYPFRYYATAGGLLFYGPDQVDQFRLAAGYVDRILRGEKPADLPVQTPTKYDLVINLKTAKALGLTIPETLLATADEVIQ
jgi:putative ABC transport system substrate-binding protein